MVSAWTRIFAAGLGRFIACTGNPRKMPKRVVNNHGRDTLHGDAITSLSRSLADEACLPFFGEAPHEYSLHVVLLNDSSQ